MPSDALSQCYCLTWASLTLDVGYPFTAAPAKRSRCSLPWTWVASLGHAPAPSQPLLFIYHLSILGFPHGSLVKNLPANAGDAGDADLIWVRKIPWWKWQRIFQKRILYSCLENPMDRGAWRATLQAMELQESDIT